MRKPSSLHSFPVGADILDADEARDEVDEEIHRNEDVSIKVTQSPGFLCHIEASAAFRMPAHTLYRQVITHPENSKIFRHMDRCSFRRVLHDDGHGRRTVKVAHEASWRFLWLKGTFTTKLDVEEDDNALTMDFRLDPSGGGIMKRFHGRWTIRPHPKDPQHASLSTLDQDLALGVYMPPPLYRILKRICCNQTKRIFEDVQKEAENINKGKPTLCPWEEVRDKQFGQDEDEAGAAAVQPAAAESRLVAAAEEAGAEETEPGTEAASLALGSLDLKQS